MLFNAPKPNGDGKNGKANAEAKDNKDDKGNGEKGKDDQAKQDGDPKGNSEKGNQTPDKSKSDDKKDGDSEPGKQPDGDADQSKKDDPKKENKEVPEAPKRRKLNQEFVSLGSLAQDSPYRFLATFDNRAGSVHRLELVQRKKKREKLKYKDLEVRYGYLGHLDLTDSDAESEKTPGLLVRTVGQGTPADVAGIQVGDRILKFNDETVATRLDFEKLLRETHPGDEVSIRYARGGEEKAASAILTRQPLEVIRPTIVPELAAKAFERVDMRKSFAISVFEPTGTEWKPLGNAHEDLWEAEAGKDQVQFYYPYRSESECLDSGFDYQVIKTFRLEPVAEEDIDDVTSMNYHLNFDVEIKNLGKQPKSFAYRVDGPNGLPTEDWWFAIKIHGEWAAVFTQAGARDIVASTVAKSFHFIGGPKIFTNGTKPSPEQRKPVYVIDPGNDNSNAHELKFIGIDSHYFVSALIPTVGNEIATREAYSAYALPQYIKLGEDGEKASVIQERKKETKWYRKLVPVNFKAYFVLSDTEASAQKELQALEPNQSVKQSYFIFAGPKEPALLTKYGIDDTVTFGWFAAFSWPLVKLLHVFFAVIGNYAIAIVLLTILVRLAMMRFSRKMVLNSQMMQLLAPEIKAISEKFKDDFQAKSRAQQELFRKYNYNPFSGCLVMLIQLPVFIGLYRGLSVDMALRDQPLIPGVGWCSNLAGPDQLWRWADDLPQFFSFLTSETGWLGPYFNILPIISVALMLVQQKLFTPPPTDDQQAMMQKVMTFMMVFIGVIFFKVPAGLCIYFITSTLWAIMEKKLVPPPQLPEHLQKRLDEIKALQAKEKEDGVEPGTYTSKATTAGGNATRKHTERAKKKSQKNRRK